MSLLENMKLPSLKDKLRAQEEARLKKLEQEELEAEAEEIKKSKKTKGSKK